VPAANAEEAVVKDCTTFGLAYLEGACLPTILIGSGKRGRDRDTGAPTLRYLGNTKGTPGVLDSLVS
jgi:hypothetical protein